MNDTLTETKQAFQEPEWYFQKRGYHVRVRLESVQEFLKTTKCKQMLDIGCGDGSISLPLLNAQNRLTLLDMSDGMLARAKSRVPSHLADRVELVKGDFMGARLEPGSYDLIICLGVLAYVDSAQPFLEKITSLLKPGGNAIIEWTDNRHFVTRVQGPYHKLRDAFKAPLVRTRGYGRREIVDRFKGLGFEVAGSYRYCSPLPVVRKLLGEQLNYRIIRALHGNSEGNRAAWLGEECIFHFQKESGKQPFGQSR